MEERKIYHNTKSNVTYYIDAYQFLYSQNRPPVFCIRFEITIPRRNEKDDKIRVTMEIKSFMQYVTSQNPGLAAYLKSVLKSFSGKVKYEMLAFKSLEEEGFDMFKIVECIVNEADISFSGDKDPSV
jgi:hypothetical protein